MYFIRHIFNIKKYRYMYSYRHISIYFKKSRKISFLLVSTVINMILEGREHKSHSQNPSCCSWINRPGFFFSENPLAIYIKRAAITII